MAEISMLWNHQIIGLLANSPIILVGEGWQKVFESFYTYLGKYISDDDRKHLLFASDVQQTVQFIDKIAKSK